MSVLANIIAELFPDVGNLVDDLVTTDEEEMQLEIKKMELVKVYEAKMAELAIKAEENRLGWFKTSIADTTSARELQQDAIKSDDGFVRRFIYFFGLTIVLGSFWAVIEVLSLGTIELELKFMIIASIMQFPTMVIGYFFGSSMSSRHKTDIMAKQAVNIRGSVK